MIKMEIQQIKNMLDEYASGLYDHFYNRHGELCFVYNKDRIFNIDIFSTKDKALVTQYARSIEQAKNVLPSDGNRYYLEDYNSYEDLKKDLFNEIADIKTSFN